MAKNSKQISSPQDPKVPTPPAPRRGGDLEATNARVKFSPKAGSSIDSPANPKLGRG